MEGFFYWSTHGRFGKLPFWERNCVPFWHVASDVAGWQASQKQIKAAYYRLSMKHHPDVSAAPDAKERFALLAEAYEVLGSRRTRALYDAGSLSPSDLGRRPEAAGGPDDEYGAFFRNKTTFRNRSGPPPSGKTNIFDFDEFNRQHYGEALRRGAAEKKEKERYNEQIDREVMRQRRIFWTYTAMAILSALVAIFSSRRR